MPQELQHKQPRGMSGVCFILSTVDIVGWPRVMNHIPTNEVHTIEEISSSYKERVLTVSRLRSLVKRRRTRLVPEALAGRIRYSLPEIYQPEAEEIRMILSELVTTARLELDAAGILPAEEYSGIATTPEQRLSRREREHIVDFTALLIWLSEVNSMVEKTFGVGKSEKREGSAIELAREAIGWGGVAGNRPQLALAYLLLGLHTEMIDNSLTEAEELYRTGLELVEGIEADEARHIRLNLLYALAANLEFRGEFEKSKQVISGGMALITSGATPFERAKRVEFLGLQSQIARKRKEYQQAIEYGNQALRWSDPDYDPITHCKLLQYMGIIYETIEHHEEGLKMLLDAISMLETHDLASTGAWVYITIAQQYNTLGDHKRAHEILNRLENVLGYPPNHFPEQPQRILIDIHSVRAYLLNSEKEHRRAQELLEWVIPQFHRNGLENGEMSTCAMMATACGKQGEPEKACDYLERAIFCSEGASRLHQLSLHLNLAQWKTEANREREAAELLEKIEPELRTHMQETVRLLRLQARLCEKNGNLSETIRLEREASEIEKELFRSNRERSMRYSRILAETTLLEKMMEREKEKKQRLEHELAGAVVQLGEKKQLIDRAIALLREELSGTRARKENTTAEPTNLSHVYSILSVLQKGEKGSNSGSLLSYISGTGDAFLRQLRLDYPNLTISQERLCALLRAGLNAKEICTLLNIGSEALKARRKRLRKAFGLKTGQSLDKTIAAIGDIDQ